MKAILSVEQYEYISVFLSHLGFEIISNDYSNVVFMAFFWDVLALDKRLKFIIKESVHKRNNFILFQRTLIERVFYYI
jgi:hypothetical protein